MILHVGKEEYGIGWIDYPGVGIITDEDVANFVIKHTTWFDRLFRPRKIIYATILAQDLLMEVREKPTDDNWKF